jgi:hypothetical protein
MPKNKALSWGIIGKSAPTLAEITIWKSRVTTIKAHSDSLFQNLLYKSSSGVEELP